MTATSNCRRFFHAQTRTAMKKIIRTILLIVMMIALCLLLYATFITESPVGQAKTAAVIIIAGLPELLNLYD